MTHPPLAIERAAHGGVLLLALLSGCLRHEPPELVLTRTDGGVEGEGAEGEGEGEGAEGEGAEGEGEGLVDLPAEETCDGEDEDADGLTDERCNGCPQGTKVPIGWVCVPAGTFQQGSPDEEAGRRGDEPPHEVNLSRPFLMKQTEVTQGDWGLVDSGEPNPSADRECGHNCPVETVTWFGAIAFCNALSTFAGLPPCYLDPEEDPYDFADAEQVVLPVWSDRTRCLGYRLPTEAEWEYAARAGATTATYAGDLDHQDRGCDSPIGALDGIAWFCGNSGDPPVLHECGEKAPNAWGLHDLLGNVEEWCWDWQRSYPDAPEIDPVGDVDEGNGYRVARGGHYESPAEEVRAACRGGWPPNQGMDTLGLRPVRTLVGD